MRLQSMAYAGDRIMDMETAAAVTEAMELTGMIIMTTGITDMAGAMTVSYTHLDVYKRQGFWLYRTIR